ncbi:MULTISPECIES: galactokinase [Thermoanaerobacter]|uniref:Galactokinase n=2 Tax=Thermoanaerobacter TaxID=1754 RepID=B0K7L8_THEP3|nr:MULTISPECIES: galactokinase [Thermoanaerobacter]ABY94267.1 galactokinase [Thermoanaerobacter pseudethanolicus ATCC 33223]ADV79220.1 galactokinase [Thermoanaerobacter brockii subsp. finnii Ako-1]HBW60523.1 galactokinase [Thermoanaerobacter sp.]
MKTAVIEALEKFYGKNDAEIRLFYSPGRVNLIGEHTDYNGGYVFPCALDFGTYAAIRKRNDKKVFMASLNFDLKVEVDLDAFIYDKSHDWANYPKGVLKVLQDEGYDFSGFEIVFEGNIPNGAGLSSSASIELVTAVAVNEVFNLNIDRIKLVKLCQKAENTFVGVNCGIMDQFAVGMGKKDHAILLKSDTLEYSYVPLKLEGYKILITNTNKRRGLLDSKYNERRSECEKALSYLQKALPVKNLSEITIEQFEEYKDLIPDEVLRKRAKHVITENKRVLDAVKALNDKDLIKFGELMIESHNSLRDDYEVTGKELDTLVEEALKLKGVIGSRMTGAGFGGCTVSIVKEDAVEEFIKVVTHNYTQKIGYRPTVYITGIGEGAGEIKY